MYGNLHLHDLSGSGLIGTFQCHNSQAHQASIDLDELALCAGIQADLGAYTEDAAVFALCAGLVVLAWQGGKQIRAGQLLRASDEDDPDKVAHAKK